jgi:hypothetical protein
LFTIIYYLDFFFGFGGLKERTARILRQAFPHLKKIPSFYKGYFHDTTGKDKILQSATYCLRNSYPGLS